MERKKIGIKDIFKKRYEQIRQFDIQRRMRLRKREKDSIFMRRAENLKAGRNEIDKGSK